MNIKLGKLETGEEIVFELLSETEETVTVKNVLTMVFNGQAVQAIEYSFNINQGQELTLPKRIFHFMTEPRNDIQETYQSQFSTIITKPQGLIV